MVGVQLSSGSIATTQSDVVAAVNGSLKPGIPSNIVHIVAGASDRSPLMCAAFQGHLQAVSQLLAQGADVSAKSKKARDPDIRVIHCDFFDTKKVSSLFHI